MSSIKIVPVKDSDIQCIHALAESWVLSNLDDPSHGFLVSNFTLDEYRSFLAEDNIFVKAEVDGEIVGFLYGYSSEEINVNDLTNSLVKYNFSEEFFVIKQVCIARNSSGTKGVSSALYDWIKKEVDAWLVAAVVLDPSNPRSIAFHKKQGFVQYFEIMPAADKDGVVRRRGIWCYPREHENPLRLTWQINHIDSDSIVDYHATAAQLYTHEDNLNWTKLGMHVTFMMALMATTPYIMNLPAKSFLTYLVTGAVISTGFLLNYLFSQKILSGLEYMQHHKASVQTLEQKLSSGYGLPPLLQVRNGNIATQSKTSNILRRIPVVTLALWTTASLVLLLRLIAVT